MTRYLAVTTCNAEQWEKYGRAMATTFCRHWPAEVPLRIYAEGFAYSGLGGIEVESLELSASWLATFKTVYHLPQHRGRANGAYDFRHDAVRFAHKIAAIGAAAENADCDVLIWMDADIVTHAPVTVDWLGSLFPPPATVAWLDRAGVYPECGFLMFRMPAARKVIRELVKCYRNGSIFQLPQTHDSYVIQQVVEAAALKGDAKVHSLSGDARGWHHPFVAGPLGSRMDHRKGTTRKDRGKSHKRDLMRPRTEAYWR